MHKGLYQYAKYGGIGVSWVLTTTAYFYLGYAGGNWADARFERGPTFLLLGIILALFMSLWTMVWEVRALATQTK